LFNRITRREEILASC